MQVLLNKDVKKRGYRGDIIDVKPGYFRNYLLPNGIAVLATKDVLALAEKRNEKRVMQKEQILENSKDAAAKLKGLTVTLKEKVSEKGHLYGSVAEQEVLDAIKAATNLELSKDLILMDPIKELGEHKIAVKLGDKMEEKVVVVIEALEE
ncbi:50S ribosomal protein L9 [Candidatus Peregrinibacteria bacterium]|nr:50S ribosomal protein L9 [Candidatus Peregrinibacteria bacterium]